MTVDIARLLKHNRVPSGPVRLLICLTTLSTVMKKTLSSEAEEEPS